jgi:hypothetical protein
MAPSSSTRPASRQAGTGTAPQPSTSSEDAATASAPRLVPLGACESAWAGTASSRTDPAAAASLLKALFRSHSLFTSTPGLYAATSKASGRRLVFTDAGGRQLLAERVREVLGQDLQLPRDKWEARAEEEVRQLF